MPASPTTRSIAAAVSFRTTPTAPPLRSVWISRFGTCPAASSRSTTTCACSGSVTAKPPAVRPGYVARPYSLKDLRDVLAEVSGNRTFADEFFDKYIEGREVADYNTLLRVGRLRHAAGQSRRRLDRLTRRAGRRWRDHHHRPRAVRHAGLRRRSRHRRRDHDDRRRAGDGAAAWNALRQRKPGDSVTITIRRRDGKTVDKTLAIKADPTLRIDPIETTGGELTAAQKAMREAWLGTRVR